MDKLKRMMLLNGAKPELASIIVSPGVPDLQGR